MHSVAFAHRTKVAYATTRHPAQQRRLAQVVQCVGSKQQQVTCVTTEEQLKQAVLCTKFKAHDAAVTALAVLRDEPGGSCCMHANRAGGGLSCPAPYPGCMDATMAVCGLRMLNENKYMKGKPLEHDSLRVLCFSTRLQADCNNIPGQIAGSMDPGGGEFEYSGKFCLSQACYSLSASITGLWAGL